MDPFTSTIIGAIIGGIVSGITDKVAGETYQYLKTKLSKLDKDGEMVKAIDNVEKEPNSESYIKALEKRIEAIEANKNPEVIETAQILLNRIENIYGDKYVSQTIQDNKGIITGPYSNSTFNLPENKRHEQYQLVCKWDLGDRGTRFRGFDLSGQNLSGLNLEYADFTDANLSNTKLRNTSLSYADLTGANLIGANLHEAKLLGTKIEDAKIEKKGRLVWEIFNLNQERWQNLSSEDLSETNLTGADLTQVILRAANLNYANLKDAKLDYADLSEASLHKAKLTELKSYRNTIWPIYFEQYKEKFAKRIYYILAIIISIIIVVVSIVIAPSYFNSGSSPYLIIIVVLTAGFIALIVNSFASRRLADKFIHPSSYAWPDTKDNK
ncbi:MAG: hypothetical protein DPW09_26515 [Anaerolineae bacterium]|nr:hypothetical protein [Anaerolineae bacterium]